MTEVRVDSFRERRRGRAVLAGADEAVLGVAFVQRRGVSLVERQLQTVPNGRLVTTTVFGSTTAQGLDAVCASGFAVRVLNPSRGTFHPKLYLARHGNQIAAAIGSANLTSGLVANVELVAVLRGPIDAPEARHLVELGESWWAHPDAVDWSAGTLAAPPEVLEMDLLTRVTAIIAADPVIVTLSDGRCNRVTEITPDGVWVETERSLRLGRPPQVVEAWMIQSAWDYLKAHGTLSNRFLLSGDGLNVKRSSFVCALLARLPDVEVRSIRPIVLALRSVTR